MVWSGLFAPKYMVGFGQAAKAMTADEILLMQAQHALAQQNAFINGKNLMGLNYIGLLAPYKPYPEPSIEERHADIGKRLDLAMDRFEKQYGYRPS